MDSTNTNTTERRMFLPFQAVADFFKEPSGPKCPECSSVFIDGACPNLDCPLKVAEWIIRWCSPEAANIPALGQAEAGQLANLRLVLHPGELYELGQGDWDRLEGVSADQLADIQGQMEGSKSAEPSAVLYGLNLPGVDERLAKRLIEAFSSIDGLRVSRPELLQQIEGIDERQCVEIRRWFRDPVNKQALTMLEQNDFNLGEQ
jgi:DNA ligase (NAD+)